MSRFIGSDKMRRIREEQERLLEGATPPRNRKHSRVESELQREEDLSYRVPDSNLYERFSARLESLTLDLNTERSQRKEIEKNLDVTAHSDAPENSTLFKEEENWCRIVVEKLSDWLAALPRFAVMTMDSGTEAYAVADDRSRRSATRKMEPSNFCTWRQDDMQLSLRCRPKKPYTVTLHVDEGADVELSELCWIDEDSLGSAHDEPIEPRKFPLKRIDERTYRVVMRVGVFNGRMGSLTAARERESKDSIDPRLLLPFVN